MGRQRIVSKPDLTGGGCWVSVRRYVSSLYPQFSSCGNSARPGKLTCARHDEYEQRAQECKVARTLKDTDQGTGSMSDHLKPCPFCGGPGIEKWADGGKALNWIECQDCGAKGAWAKVGHDGSGARNWNQRFVAPMTDWHEIDGDNPAPRDIKKGDYVLATKYSDGDPGDHWGVGFYDREEGGRHFVVDGGGKQIRANGFRRVGHITPDYGAWLLKNAQALESSPPGTVDLWGMQGVNAIPDSAPPPTESEE